jgi:hypothetical protein
MTAACRILGVTTATQLSLSLPPPLTYLCLFLGGVTFGFFFF